jgi:hypothetical protein
LRWNYVDNEILATKLFRGFLTVLEPDMEQATRPLYGQVVGLAFSTPIVHSFFLTQVAIIRENKQSFTLLHHSFFHFPLFCLFMVQTQLQLISPFLR